MKTWFYIFSIFFFFVQSSYATKSPRVVYGNDDQIDYFEIEDPRWKLRADSTVALVSKFNLQKTEENNYHLTSKNLAQSFGLCEGEAFYKQNVASFCSGSLVANDIVMTAGHCVRNNRECKNVVFLFDFAYKNKNEFPEIFENNQIYRCNKIIKRISNPAGPDFALIQLDRMVEDRSPLPLRKSGQIEAGTPLVSIGHPLGLPTKIAAGAAVRDNSFSSFFNANLDTFNGSSGGAIFNANTGEVEGILARGEQDLVYDKNNACRKVKKCLDKGCRGEDVVRISEVLPFLN